MRRSIALAPPTKMVDGDTRGVRVKALIENTGKRPDT